MDNIQGGWRAERVERFVKICGEAGEGTEGNMRARRATGQGLWGIEGAEGLSESETWQSGHPGHVLIQEICSLRISAHQPARLSPDGAPAARSRDGCGVEVGPRAWIPDMGDRGLDCHIFREEFQPVPMRKVNTLSNGAN